MSFLGALAPALPALVPVVRAWVENASTKNATPKGHPLELDMLRQLDDDVGRLDARVFHLQAQLDDQAETLKQFALRRGPEPLAIAVARPGEGPICPLCVAELDAEFQGLMDLVPAAGRPERFGGPPRLPLPALGTAVPPTFLPGRPVGRPATQVGDVEGPGDDDARRLFRRLDRLEDRLEELVERPCVNWVSTTLSASDLINGLGQGSVEIPLQHDFRSDDVTFTGSTVKGRIREIWFGDVPVLWSKDGVPLQVFAPRSKFQHLLKGRRARAGMTIRVVGKFEGSGELVATFTGKKPVLGQD